MGEMADEHIDYLLQQALKTGDSLTAMPMFEPTFAEYKDQQTINFIRAHKEDFIMPEGFTIDMDKKKCVTPVCRGSYVNILEPRQLPDSEKLAWGMQCLFPKTDPIVAAWIKALNPLYGKVLIDKFGEGKAQEIAKQISILRSFPIRDGDKAEDTAKISNADQLVGHYFMNTNNQFRQPYVIGPMGKPVNPEELTPDDIYSGAWYRVMLEFWYYDKAGNKGISTSIAALMKVKDDVNLGAGTTTREASDAFGDFAGEAASIFTGEEDAGKDAGEPDPTEDFDFM